MLVVVLVGVMCVVLVVVSVLAIAFANESDLERWADENGLTLVSVQRLPLSLRFFPRAKGQRVYAIEVVDGEGRTRRGVAKVGDFFFGALVHRVVVRWD